MKALLILVVLAFATWRDIVCTGGNEFFTAASDMEILLKVERKLAKRFLKYMETEEKRLAGLEASLSAVEKNIPLFDTPERFLSHVTNAHGVIHRLTKYWPKFGNFTKSEATRQNVRSLVRDLTKLKPAYPAENDLMGALQAITRLQETYKLSASRMIEGLREPAHKLSLEETFEIGYLCLQDQDYENGHVWLKEALYRMPPDQEKVGFVDKLMLLEHLAWCEYYLGKLEDAIKHTRAILVIDAGNTNARVNLELYERDLEASKSDLKVRKNFVKKKHSWTNHLNKLCQGREKMAQKDADRLYCEYTVPHLVFTVKPLKTEMLYLDKPKIVLYHELVSEAEMTHIRNLAGPMLKRAFVHDMQTGELRYADYRVSKNTWISEDMDVVAAQIIRRVGYITGLNMRYSESLQVGNYGIAGQYEPHFDHATTVQPKHFDKWGGNRIATVLLYLNDVEWGGRTVFTNTGAGVGTNPIKGAGVTWYNLKRNGDGDTKTQHAGCPVVLGQKWVSNLWIHAHGQEFIRPCTLNPDE